MLKGRTQDVNAKDNNDRTALHEACHVVELNFIKLFLKNGADVNAQDKKGNTPLHEINSGNHWEEARLEIVKFLIKNGANINTKNNKNETPLDIAHKQSNKKLIEFFENFPKTTHQKIT